LNLTVGALFQLIKLPEENEKHAEFICRLSQDHRLLTFEGSTGEDYEPVELVNISELNLLRSPDIPPGKYCYTHFLGNNLLRYAHFHNLLMLSLKIFGMVR
jgi:hypothetical protein